jgi:phytoene/squalene synthetase
MIQLFHKVSEGCSQLTTEAYSTSFSSAIRLLHHEIRQPVYNIYGFVRFADEIVDSFHGYDKPKLLNQFKLETYSAIENGLSLNPILHSFQITVKQYSIDLELIEAFFRSMEMDLTKNHYDQQGYSEYIYGSAEVVGLMCLHVFCEGDKKLYGKLKPAAQSLGAAFQKVNFLRDMKSDYADLNRIYFPGVDFGNLTAGMKSAIEADIALDFQKAYAGIINLPWKARFGVYVAYKYYLSLFLRIKRMQASKVMRQRIRIPNYLKAMIVVRAGLKNQLKLIA